MTHGIPDSPEVPDSPEELIRAARKQRGGIVSPALPELHFGADDSGMLDLAIAMEQLIAVSGGASLIQLLHASVYVLEMCELGFKEKLASCVSDGDPAISSLVRDAGTIGHALRCVREVAQRPTAALAMLRMKTTRPGETERSMLRFLVSERFLRTLEIDPEAYYVELTQRHV